jgi:hypothetical protein
VASDQQPGALYANEVKVIPNYPANNLLLTISLFFFIVAATNLTNHLHIFLCLIAALDLKKERNLTSIISMKGALHAGQE